MSVSSKQSSYLRLPSGQSSINYVSSQSRSSHLLKKSKSRDQISVSKKQSLQSTQSRCKHTCNLVELNKKLLHDIQVYQRRIEKLVNYTRDLQETYNRIQKQNNKLKKFYFQHRRKDVAEAQIGEYLQDQRIGKFSKGRVDAKTIQFNGVRSVEQYEITVNKQLVSQTFSKQSILEKVIKQLQAQKSVLQKQNEMLRQQISKKKTNKLIVIQEKKKVVQNQPTQSTEPDDVQGQGLLDRKKLQQNIKRTESYILQIQMKHSKLLQRKSNEFYLMQKHLDDFSS